jgi:hypothetical protein
LVTHRRPLVAIVLLSGAILAGTGLAAADALPRSVEGVARGALAKVGVGAPGGPERYKGPECDASKGDYKNHGQYVKLHKDDPAAAQSRCGKPIHSGETPAPGDEPKPDKPKPDGGPCQGPPPWAGKSAGKDKAAKTAAQAERRARCGVDEDETEREAPASPTTSVPAAAPTTTVPPTTIPATTTTTASSTTTIATTTTQL